MSLDERVSDLIKRIYSAREDEEAWNGAAHEALALTGCRAGLSTVVDLENREFDAFRFYGAEDTAVAVATEEYADLYKDDPSLIWAATHPNARFCDSTATIPKANYLTNPYIQWNRARMKSIHWYVGYTPPSEQLSFSFSVHFPEEQGFGRPKQIALFRMLFDHMECAVRLTRRPFNPVSSRALLLLDAHGQVEQLSSGAELLLAQPGAVAVRGRRLAAAYAGEQRKIDAALAQVSHAAVTGAGPTGVRLSNPAGNGPWTLTIRPVLSSFGPFGHVTCHLLVEIHAGLPKIGSLAIVQSLFDLTGRELQVVRLLADGHSPESLAQEMQISFHTARAHLRSIFAKTGTSRQSELMHLAAGLAT